MLQYYQLVLVRAGKNSTLFKRELRNALINLKDPKDREQLRAWFKSNVGMVMCS